jgi:hypothetical protein
MRRSVERVTPVRVSNRTLAIAAAALTVVAIALHWWFTPRAGFIRSVYPTGAFTANPTSVEPAPDLSLAFATGHASRRRGSFGVQWRGFL